MFKMTLISKYKYRIALFILAVLFFALAIYESSYKRISFKDTLTFKEIEILRHKIPVGKFLPNFRNPCWLDGNDEILCLPYFFLAGIEKCGTTDLYQSLLSHPLIFPAPLKESHYWSKGRHRHISQLDLYMSLFKKPAVDISHCILPEKIGSNRRMCQTTSLSAKISAKKYYPGITLDASADTLLFNFDWKTNAYPLTNTPQIMKSILPNAKFVIIIRDPTERLYSSYKSLFYTKLSDNTRAEIFEAMNRKSRNDFHQKVELAIRWFKRCINDTKVTSENLSFLSKDVDRNRCYFWSDGETTIGKFITHLQIGIYVASLREWLRLFPVSSFKVVRLEDYSRNKLKITNEIFQFLGLPRLTELKLHVLYSQQNSDKLKYDLEMFDKTRKLLDTFYAPYTRALNKLFFK